MLGIYRADSAVRAARRTQFLRDIFNILPVEPFTRSAAEVAAKIRSDALREGLALPFADALIAATALAVDQSILTTNVKDFARVPGLTVIAFEIS